MCGSGEGDKKNILEVVIIGTPKQGENKMFLTINKDAINTLCSKSWYKNSRALVDEPWANSSLQHFSIQIRETREHEQV